MRKLGTILLGACLALVAGLALAATSPNNTVVLAGSTAAITDAAGNLWTITAGGQVAVQTPTASTPTVDTTTASVIEIAYVAGTVWQENSAKLWFAKTSPTGTWSTGTTTSPLSVGPAAALSWTAPTANTDGTAINALLTYNIYQGLSGALVKVQSAVIGLAATITTGLTAGTTQCFAVSAIEGSIESAQSAPACAAVPQLVPGAPMQITVVIR